MERSGGDPVRHGFDQITPGDVELNPPAMDKRAIWYHQPSLTKEC